MLRLISFKIISHPILNGLYLDFVGNDNLDDVTDIYSSVLIGQNGTGKSEILSYVSQIFRALGEFKEKKTETLEINYKFELKYRIDENTYEVSSPYIQSVPKGNVKPKPQIQFYKNKPIAESAPLKTVGHLLIPEYKKFEIKIKDLELPNRVIVSSIMLTDKFNSKSTISYKYLGVRTEGSAQTAGTKSHIRRTVDFIIKEIDDLFFIEKLKELLIFLDLKQSFYISYVPRYRNIFMKGDLTIKKFHDSFSDWEKVFNNRKSEPWGYEHYKKIKDDHELITQIVDFLNRLSKMFITYGSRGKFFSYDILNDKNIKEDFELIRQLNWLNLISSPSISIKKNESKGSYNLENSSSGESHFITSMIGLLATIKNNSIVLIDEPEISLHPNWQMKYFMHLKHTFKSFASCHFIIATHSHFIISNLKPATSSVISLTRNSNNSLDANTIEAETYGWSIENILYTIFHVKTTRNYYLEQDLDELLSLVNEKKNQVRVDSLIKKIELLDLPQNDPLRKIISRLKN